jgi:hypothetical protein
MWLVKTYADMGRMEEARAGAQELLKLHPSFSVEGEVNVLEYQDRTVLERMETTLRQLGLPE